MPYPTFRLETLGTVVLKGPEIAIRAADQRQQRRRLALLAALASAGEKGMSRDQLLLLFWPDSTQKKARHSLDQLLYAIRSSLGETLFLGTNPIRLSPEAITADVSDFNRNISTGDLEAAVAGYAGPFLEGFYLSETKEFEEWVDGERRRLAHSYQHALEELVRRAEADGDSSRVVHWRRKLVEADPFSTRQAIALMNALTEAGDASAAILFGERFERDTVDVVGAPATAGVRELVAQLREITAARPAIASFGRSNTESTGQPASRLPAYLAAAVVTAFGIGAVLFSTDRESLANANPITRGTDNLAAYDYYLRGKDLIAMRNDSSARVALGHFKQATESDSGFAAAHAGLSRAYTRLAMSTAPGIPRHELRQRALSSARKAISLNDSLADGFIALGLIYSYWLIDLEAARTHLERAVALDPKEPGAREFLAITYMYLGRTGDALRQMQTAVANDPLGPSSRAMLAATHYMLGQCDLAIPALDSLGEMNPPLLRVAITRSLCHAADARWADAASTVRGPATAGGTRALGLLGLAQARSGNRAEARALRATLRKTAAANPAAWFDASVISYGLNEMDSAFSELGRSADAGVLPWELFGPVFLDLRSDPRFVQLAATKGIRAGMGDTDGR